jgi:tetratricopeptide (TPR) repeat protein
MRWHVHVLICAAVALTTPAFGSDTAGAKRVEELDQLFGKLRSSTDGDEARTTQSRIWSAWMQSGSVTQDLILQQATHAMIAQEYYTSEEMLNALVARQPDGAEPYNKRAELYFMMGRLDDALRDTERALDREPRHFGALAGRGLILQWLGKDQEALVAYRAALAINPNLAGVASAIKLIEKQTPEL